MIDTRNIQTSTWKPCKRSHHYRIDPAPKKNLLEHRLQTFRNHIVFWAQVCPRFRFYRDTSASPGRQNLYTRHRICRYFKRVLRNLQVLTHLRLVWMFEVPPGSHPKVAQEVRCRRSETQSQTLLLPNIGLGHSWNRKSRHTGTGEAIPRHCWFWPQMCYNCKVLSMNMCLVHLWWGL